MLSHQKICSKYIPSVMYFTISSRKETSLYMGEGDLWRGGGTRRCGLAASLAVRRREGWEILVFTQLRDSNTALIRPITYLLSPKEPASQNKPFPSKLQKFPRPQYRHRRMGESRWKPCLTRVWPHRHWCLFGSVHCESIFIPRTLSLEHRNYRDIQIHRGSLFVSRNKPTAVVNKGELLQIQYVFMTICKLSVCYLLMGVIFRN